MDGKTGGPLAGSERTRQQERAERVLDAAAELMLRWGYKRVTMEDIAAHAGIGKGTIYLHWKTKDALFGTLLLREIAALWQELVRRVRADPTEAYYHRAVRALMLLGMRRPLARALYTGDREILGKLAGASFGNAFQAQATVFRREFVTLLRSQGLLRSDVDLPAQMYALRATITGFLAIDPFLSGEDQLSLEEKAEALSQTVRDAFEPESLPTGAVLAKAAAILVERIEQLSTAVERQLSDAEQHAGQTT
jgi:AcrR family transcriptional regulator